MLHWQVLRHIHREYPVRVDVLPRQRRQRPEVSRGQPSVPLRVCQDLLDYEGSHVHEAHLP